MSHEINAEGKDTKDKLDSFRPVAMVALEAMVARRLPGPET